MFSWLSSEGLPHGERPDRYYSKARFVLDSFYSLYCPDLADEIDELCVAVDAQTYTLDHVLTKLCERFQLKGPQVSDWTGEFPAAVVKYRIDRFYLTYDPSSLDKTPDLVNHICSGKYPFNVVLNKMCARFADQGAVLANWGDDYPIAMRQPLGTPFPAATERKVGDEVKSVIDGRLYQGRVQATEDGSFTVKYTSVS
eukprot:Rhum_TRINITY_DN12749_c1_g1::Rhum_TRINITY_DN12749_c1_g1_i1::g.54140::m.54140